MMVSGVNASVNASVSVSGTNTDTAASPNHDTSAAAETATATATAAATAVPTKEVVDNFMSTLQIAGCGMGDTDLSSLYSTSTDLTSGKADTKGRTFYMNMCGTVHNTVCTTHDPDMMVCQDTTPVNPNSLAKFAGGKGGSWTYLNGGASSGIQAVYDNGDNDCFNSVTGQNEQRVLTMQFMCAKTQDSTFAMTTAPDDVCKYSLTMNTPAACPPGSSSGLSGGWIFIIILCVCIPIYVAAGCIYKTKRLGATGMERCPNVDFWRDLPRLVKEGFVFTFQKTKQLCGGKTSGGGTGTYETI